MDSNHRNGSSPHSNLIESLSMTRTSLEVMLASLVAMAKKRPLRVDEESQQKRAKKALRKINNDYLPWARSPAMTVVMAAKITLWLIIVHGDLDLLDN